MADHGASGNLAVAFRTPMKLSIATATRRKPAPRHINPATARNSPETRIRTVSPAGISQKKWSPSRKKRSPVKRCFRIKTPRSRKPPNNPIHKAINNTVPGTEHATNEPFPVLLISSAAPAGSFGPIRILIDTLMNSDDFARAPATSSLAQSLEVLSALVPPQVDWTLRFVYSP